MHDKCPEHSMLLHPITLVIPGELYISGTLQYGTNKIMLNMTLKDIISERPVTVQGHQLIMRPTALKSEAGRQAACFFLEN
jgi:hypothetical protein